MITYIVGFWILWSISKADSKPIVCNTIIKYIRSSGYSGVSLRLTALVVHLFPIFERVNTLWTTTKYYQFAEGHFKAEISLCHPPFEYRPCLRVVSWVMEICTHCLLFLGCEMQFFKSRMGVLGWNNKIENIWDFSKGSKRMKEVSGEIKTSRNEDCRVSFWLITAGELIMRQRMACLYINSVGLLGKLKFLKSLPFAWLSLLAHGYTWLGYLQVCITYLIFLVTCFQVAGKPFCQFEPNMGFLLSQLVFMTLDWPFWASRRLTLASTGIKTVENCHSLFITYILLNNEVQNISDWAEKYSRGVKEEKGGMYSTTRIVGLILYLRVVILHHSSSFGVPQFIMCPHDIMHCYGLPLIFHSIGIPYSIGYRSSGPLHYMVKFLFCQCCSIICARSLYTTALVAAIYSYQHKTTNGYEKSCELLAVLNYLHCKKKTNSMQCFGTVTVQYAQ
ncbi:putative signal peptide protein [Puccinia sorghi]|uniref:Putative signal peptide protein n=1 Tax=Puccinia sorghi TaxID=27349 RepID=A0A0L6VTV3_9BASI|nr:putative signal peptide protein [Puccinia sorghi]